MYFRLNTHRSNILIGTFTLNDRIAAKVKAGDKLKVDFFQPDEANPKVSAAGIWPVQSPQ